MDGNELNEMFGVTDAELEELASEYESEAWSEGSFGPSKPGRPRLYDEDMGLIAVRLPHSKLAALEVAAKRAGKTRSQLIRDAIDAQLAALA